MKTVVIVCMSGGITRAQTPPGAEIWGVNLTYRNQQDPPLTRLYFMDDIEVLDRQTARDGGGSFAEQVNALGVPCVGKKAWPEIPKCRAYDLAGAGEFFGYDYYTSSVAYMMADAIREGFECVLLHRLMRTQYLTEYMDQKPCLDYWVGQMHARGIKTGMSSDCNIGKPYPWQTYRYGYEQREFPDLMMMCLLSGRFRSMHTTQDVADIEATTKALNMGLERVGNWVRKPENEVIVA